MSTLTPLDPIQVHLREVLNRPDRASGILGHSRVIATYAVMPDEDGAGGNFRFRVDHGLRWIPNRVHVDPIMIPDANDDLDTAPRAAILGKTSYPKADATFSYFTLCCPPLIVPFQLQSYSNVGGGNLFTFDSTWGSPLNAHPTWDAGGSPTGQLRVSYPSASTVRVSSTGGALDNGLNFHLTVFFGNPVNTNIKVEVISEMIEFPARDVTVYAPGTLAHPIPDA